MVVGSGCDDQRIQSSGLQQPPVLRQWDKVSSASFDGRTRKVVNFAVQR